MVEDIKQEENLSVPSSGDEEISSQQAGVEEENTGTPGQEEGATPGASETPPSEEQELLADGTPKNKPIPYDEARRMAETAALRAKDEVRREFEKRRRAAEEQEQARFAEREASSRREKEIKVLLDKYHPDYRDTMRPIVEHNVDTILRMEERTRIIEEREAELLGRDFLREHPDVKVDSPEYNEILNKISSGVSPDDAHKLVMKSENRIREDERKKVLEEIKTRNEKLGKSGQLGGVGASKGKSQGNALPVNEDDENWFRSRVR